jgi:beta-lactamase regulating signal transducer with metallopeptidase domain
MHELMTMMSGWLMHYLTRSAVTLVLMGAMAWLGDRWLRRLGPAAQHRLWLAALLAGVLLPLLPAGVLTRYYSHADAAAAGGTVAVTYHLVADATARWALTPRLSQILAGTYLLTVLFSMTRLLWRWRRTYAMAGRSAVLPLDARECGRMESAARRLGVTPPEVRCSVETRGPVVLGLRRAMLLVPEGFFAAEGLGAERQEDASAALAHECAHIARRDYVKNLSYEFAAAVVAYHPVSWRMRRRIAETRELLCDEMAAAAMGDRPEYAASLLRLATAMAGPAVWQVSAGRTQAIGVFDADILEERIMRLTMDVPKISRIERIAMVTLVACTLASGALGATAMALDVSPQTKEAVYTVGPGVSAPVLSYSVDAAFPRSQRKGKLDGVSIVGLIVNSNGMPQDLHIEPLTTSMSKTLSKMHPNKKFHLSPDFDKNAMEAVRQYRFHPGLRGGKPVAVAITIVVNFHIY